jgi:hypothetical protein
MATILRAFIIGFLIAGMLFAGMSIFMGDIANNYGVTIDGNMTKSYNSLGMSLNQSTSTVYSMQNKTEGGEGITSNPSNELVSISPTIWGVIKTPFEMLTNFVSASKAIVTTMGIPTWFYYGLIAIISITLTLIVLSILFRWDI